MTAAPSSPEVEVEVLMLRPPDKEGSMSVIGTILGDIACRPYTFKLSLTDAEEVLHQLKHMVKNSEEPIIFQIERRHLVPLIKRGTSGPTPVPQSPSL